MPRRAPLPTLLFLGALVLPAVVCDREVVLTSSCPHSLAVCSSVDKMAQRCALGPAAHIMTDRTAEIKKELGECQKEKEEQNQQLQQKIEENLKLGREVKKLKEFPNRGACVAPNFKVGSQCYYLSGDKRSWSSALKVCKKLGGALAEPYNLRQVITQVGRRTQGSVFLGGNDLAKEGTFVGVSGRPFYTGGLWASGEPNNYGGTQEDCITVDTSRYALNDSPCGQEEKYLCVV